MILIAKYTVVALKSMGPTKGHGEDGFLVLFYQHCWHIVGKDVSRYCLSALNEGTVLDSLNATNIALIPKILHPMNLRDFRPTSLCNVIYKLIAKMVANRFQCVLKTCTDSAQSAFVPGRLITDNILVAYEFLHSFKLRRGGKKGSMALKLNINKAYDRVE